MKFINNVSYMNPKSVIVFLLICILSAACKNKEKIEYKPLNSFKTPLGKEYPISTPSAKMLEQYQDAKAAFMVEPDNPDLLIWYGRRAAYLGQYLEAIAIFTKGIEKFPQDARIYRHRGHRYISIREFNKAITDLSKAAELIRGTSNEIEPDGMPNARNIPVSTLHGNIWYHLGLAYYLKHDYEKAFEAYLNCRESGEKPDNIVSSTHWLYMIQRRLGNITLADSLLLPVHQDFDIIENTNYYTLCKFYKGLVPEDELLPAGETTPASDAMAYGLANWYFYNDDKEKARQMMQKIVTGSSWSSFGYIAAESDLIHHFKTAEK